MAIIPNYIYIKAPEISEEEKLGRLMERYMKGVKFNKERMSVSFEHCEHGQLDADTQRCGSSKNRGL